MKTKGILIAIVVVLIIIVFVLCTNLVQAQKQLADAEELIDIQHEMIERLGELDAVHATINVEVTNKATFGKITSGDVDVIADQVLRYTRKQLLEGDTICSTSQH